MEQIVGHRVRDSEGRRVSIGVSFAGHETFPFRYTWLKKAVDHVASDPEAFGREDAMVTLGVGKNMVQSIRHWSQVCGVIEEDPTVKNNRGRRLRITDLGKRVFNDAGWDPYLEDPATTWLLHWQICTATSRATTWYWVFSHLPQLEFSKPELERYLMDYARDQGNERVTEASLARDIDCFLRTYVSSRASRTVPLEDTLDCPLVELGLISENRASVGYVLNRGDHPELPDEIFACALLQYTARHQNAAKTVALDKIAFTPASPGRTFLLTEAAVVERLERVGRLTNNAVTYDETAGVRQLLVRGPIDGMPLLSAYYKRTQMVRRAALGGLK
jgi:hypothetical protein